MNRYTHKNVGYYCYNNKKFLIADLCEELQKGRKEYLAKAPRCNPFFFNKKFELMVNKHIEWWTFTITIRDVFEVRRCMAEIGKDDGSGVNRILYCTIPNVQGEPDNIFRNITEFREFLTREVYKEELK